MVITAYKDMTDDQARNAIGAVITECFSLEECYRRIESEFGVRGIIIHYEQAPEGEEGDKKREFARSLGALVMKNGAIAGFRARAPDGHKIIGRGVSDRD